MIIVQDRIALDAKDLPRLHARLQDRYLPAAKARGMEFLGSEISPPLNLARQPVTLWIRWQLADVGTFWQMRAMAGMDPSVEAFWAEVASFCYSRQREFLLPAEPGRELLPQPQPLASFLAQPRGWRETAQLHLRPEAGQADHSMLELALSGVAELPGVLKTHLGNNILLGYGAGNYTWDVLYEDSAAAIAAKQSTHWKATLRPLLDLLALSCDILGLETLGAGTRRAGLSQGIKRTALFRLLPGVTASQRAEFELNVLDMPAYIPEILNWRLSRALPPAGDADAMNQGWDYVWEQEYAELDGLNGAYMAHPHHWAYLDAFFDPESGRQIVDERLCHAYCPLTSGILGAENMPLTAS